MAVTLCVIAVEGMLRFARRGETAGGFQAGLAAGLGACCAMFAFAFAVGLACTASVVARARFRSEPQAGRAAAAVLLLPAASVFVGWSFLAWRFTGSPLGWVAEAEPHLSGPTAADVHEAWTQLWRPVVLTPVFVVSGALVARRSRAVGLGLFLVPVGIFLTVLLGIEVPYATAGVALAGIGVVALPRNPGPRLVVVAVAAAVCQIAVRWAASPWIPAVADWWQSIIG